MILILCMVKCDCVVGKGITNFSFLHILAWIFWNLHTILHQLPKVSINLTVRWRAFVWIRPGMNNAAFLFYWGLRILKIEHPRNMKAMGKAFHWLNPKVTMSEWSEYSDKQSDVLITPQSHNVHWFPHKV